MTIDLETLLAWLQGASFVFARLGGCLMVAPIFGGRSLSPRLRLMLTLGLTAVLLPVLPAVTPQPLFSAGWWSGIAGNLIVGIALGLVLLLIFEALALAGELIAQGMGLAFAQSVDPVRGMSLPLLGSFGLLLASLLFIALGGHHQLIRGLALSFEWLPAAQPLPAELFARLPALASLVFAQGLLLALPAVTALLLVNLAFGVLSRASPALNLMSVGFPATLLAGLALLWLTLPVWAEGFTTLMARWPGLWQGLLEGAR